MDGMYLLRMASSALGIATAALATPAAMATGVEKSQVLYQVVVAEKIEAVRDMLISSLEGRNYTVINQLDVQAGLAGREIKAGPILLIEFINLTKAYRVTRSNQGFEMFAPLRFSLFEEDGKTKVMALRPSYIGTILGNEGGLSAEAKNTLDEFDMDTHAILESAATGGF